jgi:hypothetical protein
MDKNTLVHVLIDVLTDTLVPVTRETKIKTIAEFCKSGLAFQMLPKSTTNRLISIARQNVDVSDFNAFGDWLLLVEETSSGIPNVGYCNDPLQMPIRTNCEELLSMVLDVFAQEVVPLLKADLSSKGERMKKSTVKQKESPVSSDQPPVTPYVTNDTEVDQVKAVLSEVLSAFAEAPTANAKEENRTKGQLVVSLFKHSWIEKYLTPTAMSQLSRTYVNDPVKSFAEDMECLVIKTAEADTFPHRFEQLLYQQLYWFLDAIIPELKEVMKLLETNDEEGAAASADSTTAPDDRVRHEHGVPYQFTPETPPRMSTWQAWISPPKQAAVINPFAVPMLDDAACCVVNRLLNQPQYRPVEMPAPHVGYGVRGSDGRQVSPYVSPIKKLLQVLCLRRTMAAQVTIWVLQLLDQHDQWGDAMQAALNNVLSVTNGHVNGQPENDSDKPSAWVATQLRRGLLKYINTGDPSIVNAVLDTLNQVLEPLGNI